MAAGNAMVPVPQQGGLDELLNLLSQFGGQPTTERGTLNKGQSDEASQLLAKIQESVSPENMSNLVTNILTRAKMKFGPQISESLGAGNRALSDTTLAQGQTEAQARATGEAAQAVLEAQTNANKMATQITDTKLRATSGRTSVKGIGAAGKILTGAALARLAKSGYSAIMSADKSGAVTGPEQLSGPGTGGIPENPDTIAPLNVGGNDSADAIAQAFGGTTGGNVAGVIPVALDTSGAEALTAEQATGITNTEEAAAAASTLGVTPGATALGITSPAVLGASQTADDLALAKASGLKPVYDSNGNIIDYQLSEGGGVSGEAGTPGTLTDLIGPSLDTGSTSLEGATASAEGAGATDLGIAAGGTAAAAGATDVGAAAGGEIALEDLLPAVFA